MKTKILWMILPLLVALTPATAQRTTADINTVAYRQYRLADNQMRYVYEIVLKKSAYFDMTGAAKKALIAAQQAFLNYRTKEGQLQEELYNGGSMLPTFKYRVLKQLTDERRRQLSSYSL